MWVLIYGFVATQHVYCLTCAIITFYSNTVCYWFDSLIYNSMNECITKAQFKLLLYLLFALKNIVYYEPCGFGGLGVACWPLVPKFAGSNLAKAIGFLGRKILSMPSFGGEVKLSVPCRRFAACKRSLNLRGSRNLGKIATGHLSRPRFHLSLLGSLASLRMEAPGG